ncbi:hypothetical protein C1645_840168 [Glomus cerebriforme]|uniref:Protein kinase domain-containing protein n=1 Tax=Glomus cerebriforme TaxID=658196 RepID=A0A397RZS1_9GLOM|nr:hypothetical protein C1645_840168 [Glomus cerebriforme]
MDSDKLKELDEHIEHCGICNHCKSPNTGRDWCNKCSPNLDTSEINVIEHFILETQHKTKNYDDNLNWITYSEFQDIKLIGEGGFAKVYSVTWLNESDLRDHIKVALKKLKRLCQPANVKSSLNDNKKVYGELPYVTPEVLKGKEYTQESYVYVMVQTIDY